MLQKCPYDTFLPSPAISIPQFSPVHAPSEILESPDTPSSLSRLLQPQLHFITMNYFKTNTKKTKSSWSPLKPKLTSRFEASGPESSRSRTPQNHMPQPNASFNLGALVMFQESSDFRETVGTPVYCITHISGDTYKLRQTGAEVDLEGWYVGQELRLAAGQNQRRRLRKLNARQ